MRILILHQAVADNATADELDVLEQVAAISEVLHHQGNSVEVLPCTLDLSRLHQELKVRQPDLVFNLVESLGGTDSLQALVPLIVESLGLPMTGSSASAILISGSKETAKEILKQNGLPTPAWFDLTSLRNTGTEVPTGRYLLKPVREHASAGMTDSDVVQVTSREELLAALEKKVSDFGRPCFAEEYIEGREFNLSVLETETGPGVLPAAEIRFVDFPPGKPRIVGSAAKWETDSFEYRSTVRSFDFSPEDEPVLANLEKIAKMCWSVLKLRGYGRVDFRVDELGNPWILEANANPCLSPDAGLTAAAEQAGLDYETLINRIVETAS